MYRLLLLVWFCLCLMVVCGCGRDDAVTREARRRAIANPAPDSAAWHAKMKQRALEKFNVEHQVSQTEDILREMLLHAPHDPFAHAMLAHVLTISGRRWESAPHLMQLVRVGQRTSDQLAWLGVLNAIVDDVQKLKSCQQASPDDPLPLLGLGRLAMRDNNRKQAEQLLRRVVVLRPDLTEAHVQLGHLLLNAGEPAAGTANRWEEWLRNLPQAASAHPDIWSVRGLRARQMDDVSGAIWCFGNAVLLDPNHQVAIYQLSQLFKIQGEQKLAEQCARRTELLLELANDLHGLQDEARNDTAAMRSASEHCEQLGRLWEAAGWCLVADKVGNAEWAGPRVAKLVPLLTSELPQTQLTSHPLRDFDLTGYALSEQSVESNESDSAASLACFRSCAEELGIRFVYQNGHSHDRPGTAMFEVNGGGVAVLDLDLDGWPDLYWTQGGTHPLENSTDIVDQIYRNRRGLQFDDVTVSSQIHEDGFSQGVAIGDVDNDGFPDVYVANIGTNRLFLNQGDGTFLAGTEFTVSPTDHWTASCLIADLDGDRLPDLYDVNYLQGDDVLTRLCSQPDGSAGVCIPRMFSGVPDVLWKNSGDGRFADASHAVDVSVPGMGLGIVAADFNDDRRLELFVANDQMHNVFFRNTGEVPGVPEFVEDGLLSGVAVDANGRSQACMGMAIDDMDGNGRLDVFITNFYQESHCFYHLGPSGIFTDATVTMGLRESSYSLLGFGTQFIDGELDGHPDLVLTNGHVFDNSAKGVPYRMPPQYFQNVADGRFVEQSRDRLGSYFQNEYVGRGMAKIDWNADGREEFAVSHLHQDAGVTENCTETVGHFFSIRLIGTASSRDAIGTQVTVENGGRPLLKQLTAGSGFQASNERQLIFGLGEREQAANLTVAWPSGAIQAFPRLAIDQAWQLVEGGVPRVLVR